jgi:death on curing protein
MTRYLSVEQVVSLHQSLVGLLSGDPGIRDLRALDAAVAKPTLTFEAEDLYPSLAAKAAALLHALVTTAPFVTASKGTAAVAAECFLAANGLTLAATDQDLVELTTAIDKGGMELEAVTVWMGQRVGRG